MLFTPAAHPSDRPDRFPRTTVAVACPVCATGEHCDFCQNEREFVADLAASIPHQITEEGPYLGLIRFYGVALGEVDGWKASTDRERALCAAEYLVRCEGGAGRAWVVAAAVDGLLQEVAA